MTGTITITTPAGGVVDWCTDGLAGLSQDQEAAVADLRRRVAAPQTSNATDGGTASLAERLRRAGEVVDDACLRRWLVAGSWSVDKAEHNLQNHAVWRVDFPNNGISEDTIQGELADETTFIQGCDVHGHPVMVVLAARHIAGRHPAEEARRFITYCFDHTLASATKGADKFVVLFDLTGFGYRNIDCKSLLTTFDVLQNHYPERLAQLWFLNAPALFCGVWKVVSPLLSTSTRDTIAFVKGKAALADLQKVVPPEVLPKQFGGEADLVAVQASKAALLVINRQ